MAYFLAGKLSASLAADLVEPLAEVTVRIYRVEEGDEVAKASDEDAASLDAQELGGKEHRWIGQTVTDEKGEFRIDLSRTSILGGQDVTPYDGGAIEIDAYVRGAEPPRSEATVGEAQFTVGTVRPEWRREDETSSANFALEIPQARWSRIRTAIGDWAISGRVVTAATGEPLVSARVLAFDADMLADDALGQGITDTAGRFRIDFHASAFQGGSRGGRKLESSGPDVYFVVEDALGTVLLAEPKSRARDADRRNVQNLFSAELLVDV